MNAAADTDVTLLLRCKTARLGAAVMAALVAEGNRRPVADIGIRARQLELVQRTPRTLGPLALNPSPTRAGPFDVVSALDDPSVVTVRWSHLAGDARSCQELVLDSLEHAGLLEDRPGCRCVRFPIGARRPLVPADAWAILRGKRSASPLEAIRTGVSAIAPMIRPARARVAMVDVRLAQGPTDAFAVITLPSAPPGGRASRFAGVAAAVTALFGQESRRSPARLGITVDVRRHEAHLAGAGAAGNLSLVGWIMIPGGADVPAEVAHVRIQHLLRRQFWRQQLAFDAWLSHLSPVVVARGCDALISRLADRAPITLTELWRDDSPICASCSRHRRRLPECISPIVVPPALPPAGLTVGITFAEHQTVVVLRRVTTPGTSALAWIDAMIPRLQGADVQLSGALHFC